MKIILFSLFTIGSISFLYTYSKTKYISYFISSETQTFIMNFLIVLFIENVGLINDIKNFKPIYNQEHISIIGN